MKVSILGAAGEVGRALSVHLLRGRFLSGADTLQLVGHGKEGAERRVLAERVDLLDAFDETAPNIEVAADPDEVHGDIVVMAAGTTVSTQTRTRRELAAKNRPVMESFAAALERNGSGRERVVVVTNPVELGVEIFSRHLERRRVLGMGAQQDSLRFALAIADAAGVRRDRVHAWVLGEHGEAQLPVWSDVRLLDKSPEESGRIVNQLRIDSGQRKASEIEHHRQRMFDSLSAGRIREAFETVESLPPDLRIMLEPFATAYCLHSTPNATANAALDLVRALGSGRGMVVGAQVRLEGEAFGLDGVVGVPVLADAVGWSSVVCPPLSAEEMERLLEVAAKIRTNLAEWTG